MPHEIYKAVNDHVADLVARYPSFLYGLASVDAYGGDLSGREAERAIRDLKLRGLFVDCARGNLLIDCPQSRPTLEIAAKYGVPVFVHPVAPQPLTKQMVPYGVIGTPFARGTINSAALIALVESGVFTALPGLRVVVTGHAIGGLAMAAGLSKQSRLPGGAVDGTAKTRAHRHADDPLDPHPKLPWTCLAPKMSWRAVTGPSWTTALSNCR